MGKSIRSKKKKRLRSLRREIVEPFYDVKEQAKLAAQAAALSAEKVPVKSQCQSCFLTDTETENRANGSAPMAIDANAGQEHTLKPVGGIKKRSQKKPKFKKLKGKQRRRKRH